MGASTPANSYYSILVQNNEAGSNQPLLLLLLLLLRYLWWCGKDRTAIGHHRHRCRCCLLWSKEAVQGLHLCQVCLSSPHDVIKLDNSTERWHTLRNQATSSEKTPQNPTTSHSTANILTYAFLNVDMARISTSSITVSPLRFCSYFLTTIFY